MNMPSPNGIVGLEPFRMIQCLTVSNSFGVVDRVLAADVIANDNMRYTFEVSVFECLRHCPVNILLPDDGQQLPELNMMLRTYCSPLCRLAWAPGTICPCRKHATPTILGTSQPLWIFPQSASALCSLHVEGWKMSMYGLVITAVAHIFPLRGLVEMVLVYLAIGHEPFSIF